jgi:putative tricarboxylic transport membrane protein
MAPLIVVMSLIGAYAIQNAFLDVWLAVIFGIIGFVLRRMDYPLAPLVVAWCSVPPPRRRCARA